MQLTISQYELFEADYVTLEYANKVFYAVFVSTWYGGICLGVFKNKNDALAFISSILKHETIVQEYINNGS